MRYASFLFVLLLFGACSKVELPPSFGEDPVFSLDLAWQDGSSLQLQAGEDRYYLFTGAEMDTLQVVEFSGRFAQLDCLNACGPSFAIFIRNDKAGPTGPNLEYPDFLAQNDSVPFRMPAMPGADTTTLFNVLLAPSVSGGGPATPLVWTIDDTLVLTGANFQITRPDPAPFPVCLDYGTPAGGCYSRQCQTVQLGNVPSFSAFIFSNPGDSLLQAATFGGQPPYTYMWNNGTTTPSLISQPGMVYCVTVTESAGSQASHCLQAASFGTQGCTASFTYQADPDTIITSVPIDSLQLKTIILEYVDAAGKVWRSDRQPQPQGAYFIIDKTSFYNENENGRPTYQIEARFSGALFQSGGGAPLFIDNAKVAFAVEAWSGQ